jgi:4-alpha-glucanotransferase
VAFTGTHDNNTTRGWFAGELGHEGRERLRAYVGWKITEADAAEVMIRLALGSVAGLAVVPMQDYLGLGEDGRMNTPGVAGGNWGWRMAPAMLTDELSTRMRTLAWMYGRT